MSKKLPMIGEPRFLRTDTCSECRMCGGASCNDAKVSDLRNYGGIRFTSDGFDCALPVTIDSHSHCSFACLYCFSEQLTGHIETKVKPIGQTSLTTIETIFSGGGGQDAANIRLALKYDRKVNGFPCPIQLGGINDPGDNIERQQGWFLKFAELAIKYDQPVRISTKGNTFLQPEYLRMFAKAPHLFWVAFSIITCDDEMIERIDIGAPNATERMRVMKALSDIGVKTSLRFRPMLPGVSDRTPRYRQAYKTLIERAARAGCKAISYECGFYPNRGGLEVTKKWNQMSRVTNVPFKAIFDKIGSNEACRRASPAWTENIMHAVKEEAVRHGLWVGVSDPIWKQLSDTGCCCGILPGDPVFGNWERENATQALLTAKNDGATVWPEDIIPPWANRVLVSKMAALGAGPLSVWKKRHMLWAEKLRGVWNDPHSQRGPLVYFQGALIPTERRANGDIGYKYVGIERRNIPDTPFWDITPGKASMTIDPKHARHCKLVDSCDGTRCPNGCIEKKVT